MYTMSGAGSLCDSLGCLPLGIGCGLTLLSGWPQQPQVSYPRVSASGIFVLRARSFSQETISTTRTESCDYA